LLSILPMIIEYLKARREKKTADANLVSESEV